MNLSKLTMPVLLVAAVAALAGCNKPAADPPMQPSTTSTSTTPAPMSPASAASQ
jgi:type IV pilus biogenesis protein CpaD/CtpE